MSIVTEGRACKIQLLNGEFVDVVINKNHTVKELLNLANRQSGLPESSSRWFALSFINESNEIVWLPQNERITQISFPRKADKSELRLFQFIRFFPRSWSYVSDPVTLIHFFFDVRTQFMKGYLLLDYQDFIVCCASLILLCNGQLLLDVEEVAEVFNEQIRPPMQLLRQYDANLDEIHSKICDMVKQLHGVSQGKLIVLFLKHAESSLTIGSAFYGVFDPTGNRVTIAINSRCIILFDPLNIYQPKKIIRFAQVDSILWKDKTFSVTIRQTQSSYGSGEQHENGLQTLPTRSSNKTTLISETKDHSKMVYHNILSYHKFFMESQILNKPNVNWDHAAQHLASQIEELLQSSTHFTSIPSSSSLDSYASTHQSSVSLMPCAANLNDQGDGMVTSISGTSLKFPTKFVDETFEKNENTTAKYAELKVKIKSIEDELIEKLNELKGICIEEANITGVMPKEVYMTMLPGERLPPVTKRVGTAFRLDSKLIEGSGGTDRVEQLQADIQLHRKIVQAAERLANDKTTNKSVRKKRRKDFHAAAQRLRGLERGLHQLRFSSSKPDISSGIFEASAFTRLGRSRASSGFSLNSLKNWPNFINRGVPKSCPTTPRGSVPDLTSSEKINGLFRSKANPTDSLDNRQRQPINLDWVHASVASTSATGLPPTTPSRRPTVTSVTSTDSAVARCVVPSTSSSEIATYTNVGYKSSVPYRSAYRQSNFPTMQDPFSIQRSKSVTSAHPSKESRSPPATQFSVQKSDSSAFVARSQRFPPTVNKQSETSIRSQSSAIGSPLRFVGNSKFDGSSSLSSTMNADKLDEIVRHMNETANELRKSHSSTFTPYRSPLNGKQSVILRQRLNETQQKGPHFLASGIALTDGVVSVDHSTGSLDRRLLRQHKCDNEIADRETQLRDSISSGISSASSSISPTSMSRTTTFPVEFSYSIRTPTSKRTSSESNGGRLCLSVSSGRVQPLQQNAQTDGWLKHRPIESRMENLLASIHARATAIQQPNRGTIETPNATPTKTSRAGKTATMV
ncbi:hypothetical protein M3Y98_00770600 [Aphelenchoides besseyi]|nr:hypothetical protein M3Y98_00770600 [Aphelenchoides besseyi]KAI6211734.1 hypothetical protein M3Y96_00465700 [Aphelenchoides besseyi]